jgi:hypothetical protein
LDALGIVECGNHVLEGRNYAVSRSKKRPIVITVEAFAARARELRAKVDGAEREFLEYLVWGEQQSFWRDTGFTYLEMLKHLSLVDPARYDAYKKMTEMHGKAANVGVNALREAARFPTKAAQREVLDQAATWEGTNAIPISEQSAGMIARDVRSRMAAVMTRNKGYATIVAELEAAKREIARLTTENQNLRVENRQLRADLRDRDAGSKVRKLKRVA